MSHLFLICAHVGIVVQPSPRSFKMRGIPLPGYMVRSGHEASWWSEGEHLQLFQACLNGTNDTPPFPEPQAAAKRGVHVVGLVIKTRPTPLVACLQKYKVPVVLDLVDGALDNLTNYQASRRTGARFASQCMWQRSYSGLAESELRCTGIPTLPLQSQQTRPIRLQLVHPRSHHTVFAYIYIVLVWHRCALVCSTGLRPDPGHQPPCR